jgi:hypothetical protein
MSALGTSDPEEAHGRLLTALGKLGDGERVRALKVDFGLELSALLEREPAPRECEWLGDRRSGYAEVIGRDVKTLSRWSDRTITELRTLLLNDTFTGHVYVLAEVRGERVLGCTLVQEEPDQTDVIRRTSLNIENTSEGPSLPCLIYAYPRDWRPRTLTFGVTFLEQQIPHEAWAIVGESFFEVVFGKERYPLKFDGSRVTCRIENPRRDRVYGVGWR